MTSTRAHLQLSLLLLESLDAIRAEAPMTQVSLRDHLVALCEAHQCGLTEEEADRAAAHCWARIEQEYPDWVASPQGQTWKEQLAVWQQRGREQVERERAEWTTTPAGHAWQARLKSWQRLGREQLQPQTPSSPREEDQGPWPEDLPWVTQGQRPPSREALQAQCDVWVARANRLSQRIMAPLLTTGQRWGRRVLGITLGIFAGLGVDALCLTLHHPSLASALPWVGLGLGLLLAELRIHAPEAQQMEAIHQQREVLKLLREHELAQPGRDIRAHDHTLWQKYPATAALLAQVQAGGEGLLLVKDVARLNEALGETLYRNFTEGQKKGRA